MGDVREWGDFQVHFDDVLGRGGMGTVCKSLQKSLDRWVAVKYLNPSRAEDPTLGPGFSERFQVEARALAKLQDPRIVTVLQAGENDGLLWYAMELIDGETLDRRLTEKGAFSEEEARRIGAEVARALDAALLQGIHHRDVKPGNIFLLPDGSVKLADFGLARSREFTRTKLTEIDAVACTPAYASPEQAEGRATDHRSDIYSLGAVLYEMATERAPFSGGSPMETLLQKAAAEPPRPGVLNPRISRDLEKIILKCLKRDPADRYGAYADLIEALERRRPARRWFWPAAAAVGLVFFAFILASIYGENPAPPPAPIIVVAPSPPPPAVPLPPPPSIPLEKPRPLPEPQSLNYDWVIQYPPTPQDLAELDAFYEKGTPPNTPFAMQVAMEEAEDHKEQTLQEGLEHLRENPRIALRLGGLARRDCAALDRGEPRRIPSRMPSWLEAHAPKAIAQLRRERSAMNAPDEEVLLQYKGTWKCRSLSKSLLDPFLKEATSERVAGSQMSLWKSESSPFLREEGNVPILEGERWMWRAVAEAARGYMFEHVFRSAKPEGKWALHLAEGGALQLEGSEGYLACYKTGKLVETIPLKIAVAPRRVTVLPFKALALVYLESDLVFALPAPAGLETRLSFGVQGGGLKFNSLKVSSSHE